MTGASDLLITTVTFLLLSAGLGSIVLPCAADDDPVEKALLALGIGLGTLPLVILLFRVLHVPLDIRILLTLGIMAAGLRIVRGRRVVRSERATSAAPAALLLAGLLAWILYVGATKYPYLEDDDPWAHATGAHYVALQKTTAPPAGWATHYLEPYPPYYTAVMGLLHQLNPDTNHVLKSVNALIVGLSLVGAFFAFQALTANSSKALAGAAILGMMPAYMSHFIWSQTLAIPVFFVALWALERARQSIGGGAMWRDGTWRTAVIMMWSATIIQPSTAAVFAVLFTISVVVPLAWEPKRRPHEYCDVAALIGAGVLSMLTWGGFALRYGWARFAEQINIKATALATPTGDTSGGVVYGLRDIVFAPATSKIDQATGLGWFVSLLAATGIALFAVNWTRRRWSPPRWAVIMMVWTVVGLLGIEGNALPVKLFPHRFWIFLSIPIALLAADAAFTIGTLARHRIAAVVVTTVLVAVALWSNAAPRLAVQQAHWPPGLLWHGRAELAGYSTLPRLIPAGSRVFVLCSEADKAIGMGMDARPWEPEEISFKERLASASGDDVARFMQRRGYEYLTIDPGCDRTMGADATQSLLHRIQESQKFQLGLRVPEAGQGPTDDFFLLLRTAR